MIKNLRYSLMSLLVLICGSAFAQTTVTFDATVDKSEITDAADNVSITKDGVTILVSNGVLGNGSNYRIYQDKTLTISAASGSITSIVITSTANKGSKYGPDKLSTTTGTYVTEEESKIGTWTGAASEIVFTASAQARATKIEVTYTSAGADIVAAPTISGETEFLGKTEVTLEATDGDIYYTIDGTDPSTSSTKYTSPFTLWETTTVKAIAVKDGKSSAVAEKTFTCVTLEAETIGSLNEKTEDLKWVNLGLENAVVTYVDGKNIYLRENGKALMLYGIDFSANEAAPIEAGDIFNGSLVCDYDNYYGIHEIKSNKFTNEADVFVTKGTAPAPTEVTLAEILALDHICDYVFVKGQIALDGSNYYVVDAESNRVQLYKGLNVSDYADDGKNYYITAVFNAIYKGNAELQPIAVSEETPTAISGVKVETAADNAIYNIAGQRINKLAKGINIINGKKVIK